MQKLALLVTSLAKVNLQHLQLGFIILSIAMLALGLGAPDDGGTIGR